MDDVYKRKAYWALCPWCDEEKCIDYTTCKAIVRDCITAPKKEEK